MLPQAADFAAEAEELAAFLATLPDAANVVAPVAAVQATE